MKERYRGRAIGLIFNTIKRHNNVDTKQSRYKTVQDCAPFEYNPYMTTTF